jgi:hypothetical protein
MTADTIGGVWTYALELCRALRKFDTQVYLATMGEPLSRDQWNIVKKINNVEIEERPSPWNGCPIPGRKLMERGDGCFLLNSAFSQI